MASSQLTKSITVSCAGSSLVNGTYSLESKNEIKYTRRAKHPISNKPMIIEIIKSKIPSLDPKQTYFIIQARNSSQKSSPFIHYYASKSAFTSSKQAWEPIAGIHPPPKLRAPPFEYNKMTMSTTAKSANKSPQQTRDHQDEKSQEIDTSLELSHIKPTIRTFLKNTYLFETEGIIVHCGRDSKHGEFIICNDTIFHPQGGGQPTDKGTISSIDNTVIFNVEFVANHPGNHGLVCHFGSYSKGDGFKINDKVKQCINKQDRELFAKLHSGGHIIDIGMNIIGKKLGVIFEPIKGFHFPKGPYVEYEGDIPQDKRSEIKKELQQVMDEFVNNNQDLKTKIKTMNCEDYLNDVVKINDVNERELHMNKMKINKESIVRVMSIPGFDNGECMCGGTHIDGINRIKKITITKFKKKNQNFRVSYKVE